MPELSRVRPTGHFGWRRPARWLLRAARWSAGLLLLAWGLVLLAWLALHWLVLPHIDDWRPQLEQRASAALGVPLRIGSITVTSGGWVPALELRDVRLLDPQGREALRLPKVAAALSARSVLALQLRFEQLLIDAPQLEIRRDRQGRIFVAGLSMDAAPQVQTADMAEAWADWLLSQHEFVILKGRIRWVDERRAAPPLELADLNLVLRNGLREHNFRLDATPPADWGRRFSLQGQFRQQLLKRPSELRSWTGQLYADLPRADLHQLRRHVDLPFELSEGDGALRAWLDYKKGESQGVTVDLALRSVKLRLEPAAELLDLTRIEGRLQLLDEAQLLSLQARQLGFVSGDGTVWPRSDWGLRLRLAKPQLAAASSTAAASAALAAPVGGELQVQRLDMALLAQLLQRLPVGEAARARLADLAPQGVLSDLSARWDGPLEAPRSYQIKAQLDGLRMAARPAPDSPAPAAAASQPGQALPTAPSVVHPGRPGFDGLSLKLEAHERGGRATLKLAEGGRLDFPGIFQAPLPPFKQLSAQLSWLIDPAAKPGRRFELQVKDLALANADLRGEFAATWRAGSEAQSPGWLDLSGKIDRVDARRVVAYLPLAVGDHALHYVRDAIRGGEARAINFKVRGPLHEFPFENERSGQFRISTQARDIDLAYVPPAEPGQALSWPALEHVSAELVFERGGMAIRRGQARVLGYELSGISGGIKDLLHKQVLEIEGSGSGPAQELLRYVRSSPVHGWTGGMLAQTTATGPAALKLSLSLPLHDLAHSKVRGVVQLGGNELRIRPSIPLLGNARGRVEFDQVGVKVVGAQARVAGGDAAIEGGTQSDGSLRFSAQGVATAEALRRLPEFNALAPVLQAASGQAAYRLQLGISHGQPEFNLSSNLQGLALNLPAPLRKDADSMLALRVQTVLAPLAGAATQSARDELRLELGNTVLAHYQRDLTVEPARVLRGALAVQDNLPPLPASGVQLSANFDSLNLDAWRQALDRQAGAATAAAGDAVALDSPYLPNQIAMRATALQLSGRTLNRLLLGASRVPGADAQHWRFNLDAEQMSGQIELRGGAGGLVHARLSRLSLPRQEADSVSQLLAGKSSVVEPGPANASVPDLDIVVDDFELRGKQLGRLEVQARASGPQRDWHLNKLQLKSADAVLNGSGRWVNNEAGRPQRRTELDWKLELLDAGSLLERMGQGRVLRGGRGELTGQIGWAGSPLSPDYASMSGQLHVALQSGQFLTVEPGVGRLLGVLSLQSLPRRFLFDFRDVFAEGFTFDGIQGDVKIEQGVASSSNLRTQGVQASVLLEGRADLAAETQNLRVLVVPDLNAGGASLAYAAINPAIGLGTFLAQLLLSRPLAAASTREFHITGTWVEPKVEKVEHKPDEAAVPASGGARQP
ncbi:YhdP family protein [Paucibacter sp. DJ2R-2]|uniref:YhdP family protein n=1 Tax=Paucibacter sp. DJ2R-2 TaxID=2893558 RepID=UPI0021E42BE5|nr:YhdP family protein [Paucibacter sp. DJ2R-2]MCV2419729.1 TIGR02099 family protein [Paucibacter sp. DJ4R-1]MCV2437368.1 TIGR02099 family protein [Paucibacter sp. DJ2R-2]